MNTLIEVVSAKFAETFFTFVDSELKGNAEILSPELASSVTFGLRDAVLEAARFGFETFLQEFESNQPQAIENLYKSGDREKIFHTILGQIRLTRSLYYPKSSSTAAESGAHVPFDDAWGMTHRSVSPELVELALFISSDVPPQKSKEIIKKATHLKISSGLIYDIIQKDGQGLDELVQETPHVEIAESEIPEDSNVLVTSFDGANVPLREKSVVRGRPRERPMTDKGKPIEERESCYKNAMVGAISYYRSGLVTDIETKEERLEPIREEEPI